MLRLARARIVLTRLWWGAHDVGLRKTMAGLARLASLVVSRPGKAEVVTTKSGFRIAFNYPAQLMPLLVVFEELLDPELTMLHKLLGPGRVAVDVGASIGTWTLSAAKTGAAVHACEPDVENFSVLKENILSNGLGSNVIIHDLALGAGEGRSTVLQRRRRYLTNVRLTTDGTGVGGIPVISLDHFVRSVGVAHIDVLKVNTAGCEADVLLGARELFRQQKVGVAIFLDGLAVRPLLDGLRQFSYELGFYDGRKQEFIPVSASSHLDRARPGPMNRYILAKHSNVMI